MGIVFDEVVGTVAPAGGAPRETSEEREAAPPPTTAPDPARLRRELRVLQQRAARLAAD